MAFDEHPLPPATRTEALTRLQRFVPRAGRAYANERNYDLPEEGHPHVSQLSPYIRHRLITEEEVVDAVLSKHSLAASEKYVQEVFWRTYWKGWLEQRPAVWSSYRSELASVFGKLDTDAELATRYEAAVSGATDIDAFNAWARELTQTGYLHNHARMWFASIWIFTLRLPWVLGANFFMRHLLDGDPASNTLSWRWVAGLQTQGKHYIARSSNISKYTKGRENPEWRLNTQASPLSGAKHPEPRPLPQAGWPAPDVPSVLLLHEDDLSPGFLSSAANWQGVAALMTVEERAMGGTSDKVTQFVEAAALDALSRWADKFGSAGPLTASEEAVVAWALDQGAVQVVTPYAPVGPAAKALGRLERQLSEHGIDLIRVRRDWDSAAWPYATKGFFKFKAAIPDLVA